MKKIILAIVFLSVSVLAEDISSYLYGSYKSVDQVKSSLKANGLEIIGEYDAMGDAKHHVIVYSCPCLKEASSKKSRGFAAVQKVLVDSEKQALVFTNPSYFMSAFLQADNDPAVAKKLNAKLEAGFGALKGGVSKLASDDISGYHFMMGMPYYEDMIEIASGEGLGANLEAKGDVAFKLQVGNATLYGVAMANEKEFVPAIEADARAAFLPYMVLVEDNKAYILHGKYYLAISNPTLSMGDFMNISSTPGDIEEYMISLVTK